MRSKAHIKGHPIHPAIIPFPIAFLIGAFVADIIGTLADSPAFWTTASHLAIAGIAMAVIAAIPGLIDFTYTVPPRSSAKKRGVFHMTAALSSVAIFGIALIVRDGLYVEPKPMVLALEGAGALLLMVTGWLGGTLAYRNQIGVDHRYANAGKWNSIDVPRSEGTTIQVARESELGLNQMKLIRIGDKRVVLARTDSGLVAFDDHCTHKGGSLAGGSVICDTVQCPWHGSQFNVRTGRVESGPAHWNIAVYAVSVINGEVWINLSETVGAFERSVSDERQVPLPLERQEPPRGVPPRERRDDTEQRF